MAFPREWRITYQFTNPHQLTTISEVRGVCPHCNTANVFALRANWYFLQLPCVNCFLIVECSHADCRKIVYLETSTPSHRPGAQRNQAEDPFFIHPNGNIEPPHAALPATIAGDWLEAQRTFQGGNTKAAAVMFRRVLYGVLLDKGCPLHPLRVGMEQLINGQRLPAIFDEWLPAIRDDGHDAAHPDRALDVSTENIVETLEYTAELLRYVYIEPYEFQQRKARNAVIQTT